MHTWALLMSASNFSQLLIASSEPTHADIGRVKILYASATSTARCDFHSYKLHSWCKCWPCGHRYLFARCVYSILKAVRKGEQLMPTCEAGASSMRGSRARTSLALYKPAVNLAIGYDPH